MSKMKKFKLIIWLVKINSFHYRKNSISDSYNFDCWYKKILGYVWLFSNCFGTFVFNQLLLQQSSNELQIWKIKCCYESKKNIKPGFYEVEKGLFISK